MHRVSPALLVVFAAARVRAGPAPGRWLRALARLRECRAFFSPVRCCADVPWGVVARYSAVAVVQFGLFELWREYAL